MTIAKNIEASVRQRLLNLSKERGEDFGLVLSRFAIERLLFRIATSPHKGKFILKGATLFTVWSGTPHRATRDLDLLGFGDNSPDELTRTFRGICMVATVQDGLKFDDKSVSAAPIREDNIYGGIRITLVAKLGTTRIPVQVDVGFGDDLVPNPSEVTLPALLEFPAPVLRAYAKETVIAEKFHAMVVLGMSNSRMKDFFDIAWLAEHFDFDEAVLRSAIESTFNRRSTPIPETTPLCLTDEFFADAAKQRQWHAFTNRIAQPSVSFEEVVRQISHFLGVLLSPKQARKWIVGGPWRSE
ncbi:MAG: nucleotidyl transferase AbiEii/AbiGii toxin family protein [Myxococcales bacterium]|nr:nucleotidyl transferase AbiEii/AbiGii toxin family protein [Myxococcales bacterium]